MTLELSIERKAVREIAIMFGVEAIKFGSDGWPDRLDLPEDVDGCDVAGVDDEVAAFHVFDAGVGQERLDDSPLLVRQVRPVCLPHGPAPDSTDCVETPCRSNSLGASELPG